MSCYSSHKKKGWNFSWRGENKPLLVSLGSTVLFLVLGVVVVALPALPALHILLFISLFCFAAGDLFMVIF